MIEIDAGTFLSILTLLIFGPVGWMIKSLMSDIKRLANDLSQHKEEVAKTYVERDDLYRELHEVKKMIERLFEKIENIR